MNIRLKVRRIVGFIQRLLKPGHHGWCGRCGRSWAFLDCRKDAHMTDYTKSRACFPLCEDCWGELSPEDRLPYYKRLWERWQEPPYAPPPYVWKLIERAVLEGR